MNNELNNKISADLAELQRMNEANERELIEAIQTATKISINAAIQAGAIVTAAIVALTIINL